MSTDEEPTESTEERIERIKREWTISQEAADRALAKRRAEERAEQAEFPDGEPPVVIERPFDE